MFRGVFTRALQNLEVKEAADITSKFAQMEFNFGDTERGKPIPPNEFMRVLYTVHT